MHISIKMRREIFQEIEIPSGVELKIENGLVIVKGKNGENSRQFNVNNIKLEKKENKVFIECKESTKKEKKRINTIAAHIRNMISGIDKKFEYTLKICFNHFPITVELNGNQALIKNFLGEKVPRKCKLIGGAEVKITKDYVTVTSHSKEIAGQTAANFEKATRIRLRDRRIFQDGIFITSKNGKEI